MKRSILVWIAIVLFLFGVNLNQTGVEVYAAGTNEQVTYPEITPENVSSNYGYNYLGTLENGEVYQKFYNYLNDLLWEFYCSDEEVTIKEEIVEDWYVYIGIREDMKSSFTTQELKIIVANWEVIKDIFANDVPIYYFMRNAYGIGVSIDENYILSVTIQQYLEGDTNEIIEDFVSVENRKKYRELIKQKLHEYYDITRNLKSDYEKEVALHDKLMSEVDYSHEDLSNLSSHTIIGAFTQTKTVCDGYAQAFELVCNYCGIDCIWVDGIAINTSHAWNAVKLEDEWYSVDATWDDQESIRDDEQYYYSSTLEIADIAYTKEYLNVPISVFELTHKVSDNPMYPNFSDKDTYWGIFIMNEKSDVPMGGEITKEQIQAACEYICNQLEIGKTRIDLYAWDTYIIDLQWDGVNYNELIEDVINDFVSSKGDRYCVSIGYAWSSETIGWFSGNALLRTSILVSQQVDYSDEIQYYEYNIDGSGEGILLEEYPTIDRRNCLPKTIEGKEIRAVRLGVNGEQLVMSEGVKIVGLSGEKLKQVVIPETVRDIYYISSKELKAVYIPRNVKFISGSSIGYYDSELQKDFPVEKIFGYNGSVAEAYAQENGIKFYDVSDKVLIDKIQIADIIIPSAGAEIQGELDVDGYNTGEYEVIKMVFDTEDEKLIANKEYTVQLYVAAKEDYAITPNTLADVKGEVATIENIDIKNAIISFKVNVDEPIEPTPVPTPSPTPEAIVTPTPTPTPNSEQEAQVKAFVERMYTVALGREADTQGVAFWTKQLLTHEADGAGISQGFILGDEFVEKNYNDSDYMKVLYKTFFNREADEGGIAFWISEMNNGKTRKAVLAGFVNSNEFDELCTSYGIERGTMEADSPADVTPEPTPEPDNGVQDFVERLYVIALERSSEPAGLADWTRRITKGENSAEDVAKFFFLSTEYVEKETSNDKYIETLYLVFMDRASEPSGKTYWVNALENGTGREAALEGFAQSQEFQEIMSRYGL